MFLESAACQTLLGLWGRENQRCGCSVPGSSQGLDDTEGLLTLVGPMLCLFFSYLKCLFSKGVGAELVTVVLVAGPTY